LLSANNPLASRLFTLGLDFPAPPSDEKYLFIHVSYLYRFSIMSTTDTSTSQPTDPQEDNSHDLYAVRMEKLSKLVEAGSNPFFSNC